MIGKTLAHYEITSQIGKGGMGEVYQATDQKLGRDVAIKVLPEEFAKDADRVARFQREAKLLASLNHPNIAAIYGLEEADGIHFLVMELIEGQTLDERIKSGAIPVEESLKLALQIAEALEAAHEKGVIHRDLKPANIKVTHDGKVKVLDFGLAKAFAAEQADLNLSNSPTLSQAATMQGVILGTAAYMSPEQAKGKEVDKRTDVWAFGVVLYEMLTGRSVFAADDVSQTLARVLEREPDFSTLPQNLHPKIVDMLDRCMEKDVKNRYGSISDARVDIQEVLADPSGVFVQQVATVELKVKQKLMLLWASITVILIIIAGLTVWQLKPIPKLQVMRFDYDLPDSQQFPSFSLGTMPIAVSPDGRQFAFSTTEGIYLRSVEQWDARLLVGPEESARTPFFSPDGKWIGYISRADNKLKKISVNGGAPSVLCDTAGAGTGARWYKDKTIIFGTVGDGIMRVSDSGGTPETLIRTEPDVLFFPQLLPDGKNLLFTTGGDLEPEGSQKVSVLSLESGDVKELLTGKAAQYLPTGHLIYRSETNLYAIAFDIKKLETMGGSFSVVEDALDCIVSESGVLVYIPGIASPYTDVGKRTLVLVDREGHEEQLSFPPDSYAFPSISPDGARIALVIGTRQNSSIWILDLERSTKTRLTSDESEDLFPLWTPDGKHIVFFSFQERETGIYWKAAIGTGEAELLVPAPDRLMMPSSWSSDGKTLVLDRLLNPGGFSSIKGWALIGTMLVVPNPQFSLTSDFQKDIVLLSMEGNKELKPLLKDKFFEFNAQVSPDGTRIAYASNETGQDNVYVRPYPEVNSDKRIVSTSGGYDPRWSVDSSELFYRSGDAIMGIPVEPGKIFKAGKPQLLFQGNYFSFWSSQWDFHPDGRFLMIKLPDLIEDESSAAGPSKINIVLNWLEELKQKVPVP